MIVEAGSGVSTVIAGYSVEKLNVKNAKIFSLDHDEVYAEKTEKW
ncbi:MAG: hypothetical protein U5K72_14515 [Balneolaceae bacterium]|nr:hypothetical protein [Balneolaceae bacterium]